MVCVQSALKNGSHNFAHTFSPLYNEWCVKNGFIFALQFFLLISDSLGGIIHAQYFCSCNPEKHDLIAAMNSLYEYRTTYPFKFSYRIKSPAMFYFIGP